MVVKSFPPVDYADEIGLLAVGGDLDPDTLILAYSSGIFLWPHKNMPYLWFAPPERAVLFLDELHLSQSLKKIIKRAPYSLRMNTNFKAVMDGCRRSKNRKDRGTWILSEMIEPYTKLFERGYAFSSEAYEGEELVGGVYGVKIGDVYMAESMFYLRPNASKLALVNLIEHLKDKDISWFDCQVLNPFTESFGAREIPRAEFMKLLKRDS